MEWRTPKLVEIACGCEINAYFPVAAPGGAGGLAGATLYPAARATMAVDLSSPDRVLSA